MLPPRYHRKPHLPVSVYVFMAISVTAFAAGQWLGHRDTKASDAPAPRVATRDASGLTLVKSTVTITPSSTATSTTPTTPHVAVPITADAARDGLTVDHGKSQPHEHNKGKRHKANDRDGKAHDGTAGELAAPHGKAHKHSHHGN